MNDDGFRLCYVAYDLVLNRFNRFDVSKAVVKAIKIQKKIVHKPVGPKKTVSLFSITLFLFIQYSLLNSALLDNLVAWKAERNSLKRIIPENCPSYSSKCSKKPKTATSIRCSARFRIPRRPGRKTTVR